MLEITVQNFEVELINASMEQAVLLDIWAPWCGPCKALGPVLERLETAYEGRFKLAKLNSDEQPDIAGQLSQMFGVRSIPFCVLFQGGQPVDGFVGALAEGEVRKFLDKHVPGVEEVAAAELVQEAEQMLAHGDSDAALDRLQEAVASAPENDTARYDLLRALLRANRLAEARTAFLPVAKNVLLDARLAACGHWLAACEASTTLRSTEVLATAIAADRRDHDARFELAQLHFAAQRWTQAMDELLEIVMRDKGWRDQLARKNYVAILELMNKPAPRRTDTAVPKSSLEVAGKVNLVPADPVLDAYRRRLSMALF